MPKDDKHNSSSVQPIEKHVGYRFTDTALLVQALTHRSYTNEYEGAIHNERLEFLGDAILQFAATRKLYTLYPDVAEGDLSVYRSLLVKTDFLIQVAEQLEIPKYLRVSSGQRKDMNTVSTALFADAVEALIGAIYLDGGLESAEQFVFEKVLTDIQGYLSQVPLRDAKTALQEYTQQEFDITPEYVVVHASGPDHAKTFTIGVKVGDTMHAQAVGKSKQEAAQKAAEKTLKRYTKEL
ncbi:MAG: ribonuclease III [Candidatus Kaiserbacteria bacterium]|nr:ribonuclease III [Candidatus Kaiserbacteria bacterium]